MVADPTGHTVSSVLDFAQQYVLAKSEVDCPVDLEFGMEGLQLGFGSRKSTDDQTFFYLRLE